ncbi:MAG: hypothetical protein AAB477_00525 [Patescibacteria group bacterium]
MKDKSENRICQNCKSQFSIESEDFDFYKKLNVPPPTWCPECRSVRKMTFINVRSLYKRVCGNCNESMVSMYHPDVAFPVWCIKCHLSDTWDATDCGKDYDFTRTFFEQFKELKLTVPHRTLDQNERNGAGCEYSNLCYSSDDIYLSFDVIGCERIKYSHHVLKRNKNCMDCMIIKANDRGYELVQASENYNSSFLVESSQCIDSHFLYDCTNCVNCCMSSNIRNKSFVFRSQQLTKEEYKVAIQSLDLDKYSGQVRAKDEFKQIAKEAIHKYANIKNCINTVGDFLENSKNLYHCYGQAADSENVKYAFLGGGSSKDSQDLIFTGRIEECYEFTLGGRGGSRLLFSLSCGGGCKNIFYCNYCMGCSDCFGCINLSKKQYCIFNKQYTKEEYFDLIEKIKIHMNTMPYVDQKGLPYPYGECFPTEISPFAYNETMAFEEHPLSKSEIISLGYKWKDIELKSYNATIKGDEIADSIHDITNSICNEIIECPNQGSVETQCTSAYKILPDEFLFYKQLNLPIPRYCPNCRYHDRLIWKNLFHFYKRQCMCDLPNHTHQGKCEVEFETLYAPNRPEKVYCEKCYQAEVI